MSKGKAKTKKPAAAPAKAPKAAGTFKAGDRIEVVGEGSWAKGAVGDVVKMSGVDRVHVRLDHKAADSTFPARHLKKL